MVGGRSRGRASGLTGCGEKKGIRSLLNMPAQIVAVSCAGVSVILSKRTLVLTIQMPA